MGGTAEAFANRPKVALINVDATAPDLMTANMEQTVVRSAWQMTLYLELWDSTTNSILARVMDSEAGASLMSSRSRAAVQRGSRSRGSKTQTSRSQPRRSSSRNILPRSNFAQSGAGCSLRSPPALDLDPRAVVFGPVRKPGTAFWGGC